MAAKPRVLFLDDFQLTLAGLHRLGERPVHLNIQLTGRTVLALWSLRPRARDMALRATLAKQLARLRLRFPQIQFVSRGTGKPSWTIDAVVPARRVRQLANAPEVRYVSLDSVEGRRKRSRPRVLAWFCVWGVVAVQVEGQKDGLVTVEDRLMLVRAWGREDAVRRLRRKWSTYAEPYMNPYGNLVRWQLVNVQEVYDIYDDSIDPRGTEVFSRLRNVRFRSKHRWRPRNERRARAQGR
jgi:hypothetical protein